MLTGDFDPTEASSQQSQTVSMVGTLRTEERLPILVLKSLFKSQMDFGDGFWWQLIAINCDFSNQLLMHRNKYGKKSTMMLQSIMSYRNVNISPLRNSPQPQKMKQIKNSIDNKQHPNQSLGSYNETFISTSPQSILQINHNRYKSDRANEYLAKPFDKSSLSQNLYGTSMSRSKYVLHQDMTPRERTNNFDTTSKLQSTSYLTPRQHIPQSRPKINRTSRPYFLQSNNTSQVKQLIDSGIHQKFSKLDVTLQKESNAQNIFLKTRKNHLGTLDKLPKVVVLETKQMRVAGACYGNEYRLFAPMVDPEEALRDIKQSAFFMRLVDPRFENKL